MGWVKVDDKFKNHPKVLKAGIEAIGLWLLAVCWASEYESDGALPEYVVTCLPGYRPELAERLVNAGLWERVADGYTIHDFLKYNPSKEEQNAKRAAANERMTKVRRSSPEVRANKQSTPQEHAEKFARTSGAPDPIPIPVPEKDGGDARAISSAPVDLPDPESPAAWEAIRAEAGDRLANRNVRAQDWDRAWTEAQKTYSLDDLRALGRALKAQTIWRMSGAITPKQLIERLQELLGEAASAGKASTADREAQQRRAARQEQQTRDVMAKMRRPPETEPVAAPPFEVSNERP